MKLENYLVDGADYQSRAVLCILQRIADLPEIEVARWLNGREQGYVATLLNLTGEQLNIAWFEHRNSDSIHAVKWEQPTMNPPTIDTAVFGEVYKNKFDTSHRVGVEKICEMAEWINDQFNEHWSKVR
jgi:hypothetical protein